MIKLENTEVLGWEHAIRGMRNPMNSWEKSDSGWEPQFDTAQGPVAGEFVIGPNDYTLMKNLRNSGTDHRKFMRMITVYLDITGPMYWWSEFDTYKIGTVANSCSKMHKMLSKPFEMNDFSFDKLPGYKNEPGQYIPDNQKRTVMLNYEVLANIYKSRRNHKLDEWHTFCDWIENLPYSELITGKENEVLG